MIEDVSSIVPILDQVGTVFALVLWVLAERKSHRETLSFFRELTMKKLDVIDTKLDGLNK